MATKATPASSNKEPKPGYVKIKLFKDNHRYKDDVTVGWNGKFWRIKRGVEVEVPEAVAEIIENSMRQKEIVAALEDELHAEYEKSKQALD
jgi:hypothetical protein